MIRTLFYLFFVCFCIGNLQSQELNSITIENLVAGGLQDSLDADQQKKVESLTLSGSMNKDDFYFIRDHLNVLRELDMEEVNIDTIPREAFKDVWLNEIILPRAVKYIDTYAFDCVSSIYISGLFPKLASKAINSNVFLTITDNNEECCVQKGNIHSSNGKILYYFNWVYSDYYWEKPWREIEEGTEIIATRVFDNAYIRNLVFPSSLKKIESGAFENTRLLIYTKPNDTEYLYFKSPDSPVLADSVFTENDIFDSFYIHVPCREKYMSSDPQWSFFYKIVEEGESWPPPSSVSSEKKSSPLHITSNDGSLFLHAEKEISKVDVISLDGTLMQTYPLQGTNVELPVSLSGLIYVRVFFLDSESIVAKILK